MKMLMLIPMFLILVGCINTSSKATKVSGDKLDDFWQVGNGSTKSATAFFVCGTLKSGYTDRLSMKMKHDYCQLSLDGKTYAIVRKNTIGKINLSPGTYTAKYAAHKTDIALGASNDPVTIKVDPNDIVLLTANHSAMIVITHTFTIKVDYLDSLEELGEIRSYTPVEM